MTITYREINSQYEALSKTFEEIKREESQIRSFFNDARRVLFIGCGSSYNLCHSAEWAFALRGGLDTIAMPGGDVLLHHKKYASWLNGVKVVTISRSGETSEVLRTVEILKKEYGCTCLAVICKKDSSLSKIADTVVEIPWAYDESVCQTRSVTNLYFSLMLLASIQNGDNYDCWQETIEKGSQLLKVIDKAALNLAIKPWNRAFLLADGIVRGLAEEGAMALAEISGTHSSHYHMLDSRHGPMLLIDKDALVLASISPDDEGLAEDLLRDVLSRGATLAVISTKPVNLPGAVVLELGESWSDTALGLPLINLAQLTSFHKSTLKGMNPDAPEGLSAFIELRSPSAAVC